MAVRTWEVVKQAPLGVPGKATPSGLTGAPRSQSEPGRDPEARPAAFYALALLTMSQAGPGTWEHARALPGQVGTHPAGAFQLFKGAEGSSRNGPRTAESDVTALASPHSVVIILKAMRPSIKAGTGAMPLSTSGRVGRAGSTSSGGCTADIVGRAAGPTPSPADGKGLGG